MAKVAIGLVCLFESLTTFDASRYLAGLRVCVRWLPIEGRCTSLIRQLLMHLPAVLTHSAISPVNAEPTHEFIPKDEIIRHIRSPHLHLGRAAMARTYAKSGAVLGAKPRSRMCAKPREVQP
jgi:hypothetical protein